MVFSAKYQNYPGAHCTGSRKNPAAAECGGRLVGSEESRFTVIGDDRIIGFAASSPLNQFF
jgi:hypothetical protein